MSTEHPHEKGDRSMSAPFIGEVRMIAFNFPPKGWAFCNGQILAINQNQALFSVLGTTYGGNGQTTFGLPDLQARSPVHVGNGVSLGEKSGEAAHTLTVAEMAAHTHTCQGNTTAANTGTAAGNDWGAQAANPFFNTPNTPMGPSAVSMTGGSQPHNNMQPYLVINFVIALVGIFPSQN